MLELVIFAPRKTNIGLGSSHVSHSCSVIVDYSFSSSASNAHNPHEIVVEQPTGRLLEMMLQTRDFLDQQVKQQTTKEEAPQQTCHESEKDCSFRKSLGSLRTNIASNVNHSKTHLMKIIPRHRPNPSSENANRKSE